MNHFLSCCGFLLVLAVYVHAKKETGDVKAGECPPLYIDIPKNGTNSTEDCPDMCKTDSECDGQEKCCSDGCSKMCVLPMGLQCFFRGIVLDEGKILTLRKGIYMARCQCVMGKFACKKYVYRPYVQQIIRG